MCRSTQRIKLNHKLVDEQHRRNPRADLFMNYLFDLVHISMNKLKLQTETNKGFPSTLDLSPSK